MRNRNSSHAEAPGTEEPAYLHAVKSDASQTLRAALVGARQQRRPHAGSAFRGPAEVLLQGGLQLRIGRSLQGMQLADLQTELVGVLKGFARGPV